MRLLIYFGIVFVAIAAPVMADRVAYVELARRGWNYELRTTMVGRDLSIPVHIHGRDLAGASLCLVGDKPHPVSEGIINAFRALAFQAFGKPIPMRYAGRNAANCGSGRIVVLRLYSGHPPNRALTADLHWMNQRYELGLPARADFTASSPAMAQTFFGRRGQATHIMVKQSGLPVLGPLEVTFYKSILIEELFQSFTFGMDILLFDQTAAFRSKLQETPLNLRRLSWESRAFMRALVNSNPTGLCLFDVFMLHAVAEAPVDQTTDPGFIDFVDQNYERLHQRALSTMSDPQLASLFDLECRRMAG